MFLAGVESGGGRSDQRNVPLTAIQKTLLGCCGLQNVAEFFLFFFFIRLISFSEFPINCLPLLLSATASSECTNSINLMSSVIKNYTRVLLKATLTCHRLLNNELCFKDSQTAAPDHREGR